MYSVKRTEMTLDTTDLILEDFVIEPCLKFTLPLRGSSDITGFLATAEDNKVFLWSKGCGI